MPKVTGIGGVFFKAKGDPKALAAWYQEHLGIPVASWGGAAFHWAEDKGAADAATAWSIDKKDSGKYSGTDSPFMINYRVEDLDGMMANLKKAGTHILKDAEKSEYGKFASVLDPEGNKIELWEP
ncbi:MAG TPA: VOC family protein [Bdellovibrionota bacterium]|jgi:predicted enzyme related to lactoylglutathione lyase|nr:VOC family protein [Bdellovibrionota bacterium]